MLFIVVALINFLGGDHVRHMYFVKNISPVSCQKARTVNDRKANFKKFAMNVVNLWMSLFPHILVSLAVNLLLIFR